MNLSLLLKEKTATISEIQRNPTKALQGITRVMRGGKTHGFFLSAQDMEDWVEDIEMANSKSLKKREEELEKILEGGDASKLVSLQKMKEKYGL